MNMHANSYYAASANDHAEFDHLTGTIDVDVAIIGGGFTGISTALELSERGLKVGVLESKKIGWGATGRNGGQVTGSMSGDNAMAREFAKTMGKDADDFIWNLRWRGHDIIKNRVAKYKIACDLKFGHLQTAMKPKHMDELNAIYTSGVARGMGAQLQMIPKSDMPNYLESDIYCGGLLNTKNMHLHPLNLCLGEARAAQKNGALIFENSKVISIGKGQNPVVKTEHAQVNAKTVLIAGNAYHLLEQKKLGGVMFPASLANMATVQLGQETAQMLNPKDLAVYDSRFVLDYYRLTADMRLMFGGGTNYSGRNSTNIEAELRPALERTFPRLKGVEIEFSWTGMDGIVLNRIPQVGKIGDNIFYIQGYSGHGIALSHILGEIVSEAICAQMSSFDVFAKVKHMKLPMSRVAGSHFIALGMFYYRLREALNL